MNMNATVLTTVGCPIVILPRTYRVIEEGEIEPRLTRPAAN
jgi:hypothetical protein